MQWRCWAAAFLWWQTFYTLLLQQKRWTLTHKTIELYKKQNAGEVSFNVPKALMACQQRPERGELERDTQKKMLQYWCHFLFSSSSTQPYFFYFYFFFFFFLPFSGIFTLKLVPEPDPAAVATVSQQLGREMQRGQQRIAFTVKGHLSHLVPLRREKIEFQLQEGRPQLLSVFLKSRFPETFFPALPMMDGGFLMGVFTKQGLCVRHKVLHKEMFLGQRHQRWLSSYCEGFLWNCNVSCSVWDFFCS